MSDLPSGWQWTSLQDLAAPEPRAMTDGPFGSNLKSSHYVDSGPRVIRLQNIGFGEFIDEKAHITEAHFETLRAHEARPGDLVVASLGQDLPRACLVPPTLGPAIVKADCIRVRLHPTLDARYVSYALQRPDLRRTVADQIHGVGRPRLGMAGIKGLSVPVAPLAEQAQIVAAIEEHLSRLDAAESQLRTSEVRTGALWDRLVQVAIADNAKWATTSVAAVLNHTIGGVWGSEPDVDEINVRVLRVTEMDTDGMLDPSTAARRSISKAQLRSRELQVGDLLLEKSGGGPTRPVGRVGRVSSLSESSVCSNFMQLLRPNPALVLPEFLETTLRAFHLLGGTELMQTATTNIRNLKTKDYLAMPIRVPDLSEQARIVAELGKRRTATSALRSEVQRASRRAVSLRRSVLAAAFSGQLVPQDPDDEPASVLLNRIRAERAAAAPTKHARKANAS